MFEQKIDVLLQNIDKVVFLLYNKMYIYPQMKGESPDGQ